MIGLVQFAKEDSPVGVKYNTYYIQYILMRSWGPLMPYLRSRSVLALRVTLRNDRRYSWQILFDIARSGRLFRTDLLQRPSNAQERESEGLCTLDQGPRRSSKTSSVMGCNQESMNAIHKLPSRMEPKDLPRGGPGGFSSGHRHKKYQRRLRLLLLYTPSPL